MLLKISVVIPTYRRPRDLGTCLDSILAQTVMPVEIIIIDNDARKTSEVLVRRYEKDFSERQIALRYVVNNRNSLSVARNMGARLSCGDIVSFLDDDVILDKNYFWEIANVFETNPNALGVQGYIVPEENWWVYSNFLRRLFLLFHFEREGCRVFPSGSTYPLALEKMIPCQRLKGANSSYRRYVLENFQYDEKLIKYSFGEDLDHSYRVFKQYPGTLFITPSARLVHNVSLESRATSKELIYMQEIYRLYLFYKLFDPTLKNKVIYIWSRFGQLLLFLARMVIRQSPKAISDFWYLLGAYCSSLRNAEKIKRGDLEFFNSTLT